MLFIFDWDGTLCDSTGKIVHCLQQAAHEVGLPERNEAEILNIIGLGLPEAIAQLYPEASAVAASALRSAYSHIFINDNQKPMLLFDGVAETLNKLRDDGYQMAIATGKSRKGLERVLEDLNLTGFFHSTRCADETCSKPDPRMLVELLAEFRRDASEAVMVGDTEYDMEMARRVNMSRVAVSYGAHAIERLRPYKPHLCIDHFTQIRDLVEPLTDNLGLSADLHQHL